MRREPDRVLSRDQQRLVARSIWIVNVHAVDIARQWPRAREEDLRSVGHETLVTRSLSYDATVGATFETYVYKPVYFSMLDHAHKLTFGEDAGINALLRVARATAAEPDEDAEITRTRVSPEENRRAYERDMKERAAALLAAYAVTPRTPEQELIDAEQHRRSDRLVRQVIDQAPERERTLFRMLYEDGATLKQLGEALACSERHAQRIHDQLKERLRRAFVPDE
jgi:RNA polymerase sigma factor (sigma-70 family)